jgi:hypothetical protein
MSETVATTTIGQLPVDDLAQTLTYDGDFVATITVVFKSVTYIKTYTNNGTNITAISPWVAQS